MRFILHLSTDKPGFGRPVVTGHRPGINEQPQSADVLAALPHYYRRAFARSGETWWHDKHDAKAPCYVTLRNTRGKYLNTIYAFRVQE